MNTPTDGTLLRVVAHAVLAHVDRLVEEGLHVSGVDEVIAHALALTARSLDRPTPWAADETTRSGSGTCSSS